MHEGRRRSRVIYHEHAIILICTNCRMGPSVLPGRSDAGWIERVTQHRTAIDGVQAKIDDGLIFG